VNRTKTPDFPQLAPYRRAFFFSCHARIAKARFSRCSLENDRRRLVETDRGASLDDPSGRAGCPASFTLVVHKWSFHAW
jgi:hypothetical protein